MLPPAQSISILDTLRTLSWKDLREPEHPKADVQALRAVAWAPVCYLFIVLSMVLSQKASGQLRTWHGLRRQEGVLAMKELKEIVNS